MLRTTRSSPCRIARIALLGFCLPVCGCHLSPEARVGAILQEAEAADARAEADLAADEAACAGDPDCLRVALDKYTRTMREIQARLDARIDAELARGKGR